MLLNLPGLGVPCQPETSRQDAFSIAAAHTNVPLRCTDARAMGDGVIEPESCEPLVTVVRTSQPPCPNVPDLLAFPRRLGKVAPPATINASLWIPTTPGNSQLIGQLRRRVALKRLAGRFLAFEH